MATETIPVIDLGPYLAGEPGAMDRTARELRFALTEIGFYFIVNHGIAREKIAAMFAEVKRFHAQPVDKKLELKLDQHNTGYLPMRGNTLRTSTVQTGTKANLNEAFFVKREMAPDHPDVLSGRRVRGLNRWPDLPANYFDTAFSEPMFSMRMTHYPPQEGPVDDEFGLAPHTDTSFLTLLAPNEVQGLSIRSQSGSWIDMPAIDNAYVVNGGQMLQRYTNDLFLATPHRAINKTAGARYALPFFCDSGIDWPVAAVPTTVGPDKPPKYPTTWYSDYMTWYLKRNYDVLNTEAQQAAE